MTRKNPSFRISLLATAVAMTLAAPAAIAGAASIKAPQMPTATAPIDAGTRLIVTYHNDRTSNAVKLRAVTTAAARSQAMTAASARTGARAPSANVQRKLAIGADVIRLDRKLSSVEMNALMRELSADPTVKAVEVDEMVRHTGLRAPRDAAANLEQPQMTVDDPFYSGNQWHLQATPGGINAPDAWDVSTGEGIVVAVIDSGIVDHPDMDANMLPGYDFISESEISRRPTNDRVPGAHDYGDWYDDGECGEEEGDTSSFHGTHVAGTVAELTNNGIGMAGVAHNAKVLPIRALGKCGGLTSDVLDAIVWAAGGEVDGIPTNTTPAEIINLSLGNSRSCSPAYQTAINMAVSMGTTVVAAAGNANTQVANSSPASCDNVISVAAARITGGRAFYSNYGALIDLAAPGGGGGVDGNPGGYIWQAINDSDTSPDLGEPYYGGNGGTSMAAPHVAGVAALVQSAVVAAGNDPKTPAELEAILVSSVRAFPATPDRPIGAGLLDAPGALAKALEVPCDPEVDECAPPATPLTDKLAVGGLSGAAGSERLYSFEVPAGTRLMNVLTYGGTGNVSLYVSADDAPTAEVHDAKSTRPGNNETVRVAKPQATTYYILVKGEGAYSGVSIQARAD